MSEAKKTNIRIDISFIDPKRRSETIEIRGRVIQIHSLETDIEKTLNLVIDRAEHLEHKGQFKCSGCIYYLSGDFFNCEKNCPRGKGE